MKWRRFIRKNYPLTVAEVRDAFIFQCFTGFAYQDMYNLSLENIVRVGRAGEEWLIKDRGQNGCDRYGNDPSDSPGSD